MNNKAVVVTGGAQGLGREIALCFARQGWNVALADLLDETGAVTLKEIKNLGVDGLYCHCDVRKEADHQALLQASIERFGRVDLLVNNAGVASAGAIDKESVESWQRVLDINTLGPVLGCKTFVPHFKVQRAGHIVNVASIAGITCTPYMASYNVSKAGVIALSETLRWELKPKNIGVTVVCPALFKTNLTSSMAGVNENVKSAIDKGMGASSIDAADIAEQIFKAVQSNQFMLLPHQHTRWQWRLKRLSFSFYQWLMSRLA